MKTIIFSSFILWSAIGSAQARYGNCKQNEAQFIGVVSEIRQRMKDGQPSCSYMIKATVRYNVSQVCPLDQVDAESNFIEDNSCTVRLNDKVSGVLVHELATNRFWLE